MILDFGVALGREFSIRLFAFVSARSERSSSVLRRSSFLALLVSLLSGCNVFLPTGAGWDGAVVAIERASPPESGEQRIYARKPAREGTLVVFRTFGTGLPFSVGYGYLTQSGMDWQMHEVAFIAGTAPPPNAGPILLLIPSPQNQSNHTIVTGTLLDQRVRFVQLTFANGQIKTDSVENGLTGIFLEPKIAVCRMELLDEQNKALFDFELAKDPAKLGLDPEIVEWAQKECL